MQPQDVFYIVSTIVLLVFLGVFTWVAFVLVKTLHLVRKIFEEIEDTTQNLTLLKEGVKVGFMTLLSKFMGEQKEK